MSTTHGLEQAPAEALKWTEDELLQWCRDVTGFTTASFAPVDTGTGILLTLVDIKEGEPEFGGRHMPQLAVRMSYFVTPWAPNPRDQHAALLELFMAAQDHDKYQISNAQVPTDLRGGSGSCYRPGFTMDVPITIARSSGRAPRVAGSASVEGMAATTIRGRVVGPGAVPVVRAVIRVPGLNRKVTCDYHGQFRVDGVPRGKPIILNVEARGQQISKEVTADDGSFVEVKMDF